MPFGPHDAATHAIGRAQSLLTQSKKTAIPPMVRADMRRLSVVMAVAALDTYMHRLVVDRCFQHDELPSGLATLSVTFAQLLEQADDAKAAARKPPHNSRPRVGVKRQLRNRLVRETFQRYDDVARALSMAGIRKAWKDIVAAMSPPTTTAAVKRRLNEIVDRRNQIVHEGDYLRLDRPRGPRRNERRIVDAQADIDFIAAVIDAIHATV